MMPYKELTRNGQLQRLRRLAQQLLPSYKLNNSRLGLLNNVDTPVFRVDTSDERRFVLRVHNPAKQSQLLVESELLWLASICRDTDLVVPRPLQNCDGAFLTELSLPQIEGSRFVSILTWVEGRFLHSATSLQSKEFRAVGNFMARLHNYSQDFRSPQEFYRPKRDWAWVFGKGTVLDPAYAPRFYTSPELRILKKFANIVREEMNTLGRDKTVFNLIHSDLHQNNYLFKNREVRAIDFQDCAWGYFLSDMAVTLSEGQDRRNLTATDWQTQRNAFFEGYATARPLPANLEEHLRLFEAIRMVDVVNWVLNWPYPELKPWGPGYLHQAVKHLETFL